MSVRLQLIFSTASGSRKTISVNDPQATLTDAQVQAAMDAVLASNIFETIGGDLTGIIGARTVSTDITDFNVA